jgi:hypothetical protein
MGGNGWYWNLKLTAKIRFLKNERKFYHFDYDLVQFWRFIEFG